MSLPGEHGDVNAHTNADAAKKNRSGADLQDAVAAGKSKAARVDPGADKFAANAKNPQWAEGFDEKLGSRRNAT